MNLSKNELLKMAINSKPKKEILEKKSKNELIEYLFGVKVDDCSKKKINESEKRLEKCNISSPYGQPIPLYRPGYYREATTPYPPSYLQSTSPVYITQPPPLTQPPNREPEELRQRNREEIALLKKITNDVQLEVNRMLPQVANSISIIQKWNEEEKPGALQLLEETRNKVVQWLEVQKPFFESKLQQLENALMTWERVDKPSIEQVLVEIRDTRAVVQNFDTNLALDVQALLKEYLYVQKPNLEAQYQQTNSEFKQLVTTTDQIRNENIKLLQLVGPISQLQVLFSDVTSLDSFKTAIENQIQDFTTATNQQIQSIEQGYSQQLAIRGGSELTQINDLSLKLTNNESIVISLQSDIIFLKNIFETLKQELLNQFKRFLDEQSLKEINFQQQQRLELANASSQLQIEYQGLLENRLREIRQLQTSNYRELRRSLLELQAELPLALPGTSPLQAIEGPPEMQIAIRNNNLKLVQVDDRLQMLQSNQDRINNILPQIEQDLRNLQQNALVKTEGNVFTLSNNLDLVKNSQENLQTQVTRLAQELRALEQRGRISEVAMETEPAGFNAREFNIELSNIISKYDFLKTEQDNLRSKFLKITQEIHDVEQNMKQNTLTTVNDALGKLNIQVDIIRKNQAVLESEWKKQFADIQDTIFRIDREQKTLNSKNNQIIQDFTFLQQNNSSLIISTVDKVVNDTIDETFRASARDIVSTQVNVELAERDNQIKTMIQQNLNVLMPLAMQQVLENRLQQVAQDAVIAELSNQTTQELAKGTIRTITSEIVRQELNSKGIKQVLAQIIKEEQIVPRLVLSPTKQSPETTTLREINRRLRIKIGDLESRILDLENRAGVKRKIPKLEEREERQELREIRASPRRRPVVPRLPLQF